MSALPSLPVYESGHGPLMMFVHGFLNDAAVWSGVTDIVADRYRCVAVDLPGHGSSPGAKGTYDRGSVLDALRGVHDGCGGEPAIWVGHSLGGYLSLALTIEDPERVRGLGLVGAGPGFRKPESRQRWNESVEKIVADRDIAPGMEEISMHVDSMVMDRIDEITVPAAVIVGERDKGFLASAAVFEKNLNVVVKREVVGAGHMVHAKAAADVAAALIEAFPVSS